MKYKNKIWLWILFLGLILFFPKEDVLAASAQISVSGGSKTVVVGNKVKVMITVSSNTALGSWEFDVKYDSSKLTFESSNLEGNTRAVGVAGNSSTKNKTYTLTFRAKAKGSAKVWVTNSAAYDWNLNSMSTSDGSYTFNIITQQDLVDSYSSNNYLKSLSVDGYSITPAFDKNVNEYSLELENGTESVTINASKEDSTASVSGTGTKLLSEGDNQFTIRVTAQNGKVRDYILKVHVKELNPITVTVDGEDYTVLRKTEGLSIPSTFTESSTYIGEEQVPIFESAITGYRIIALKNQDGVVNFFIIHEDNTYTMYQETYFNGTTIYLLNPDSKDIPNGYEQTDTITLDGKEIKVYTSQGNPYPIVYGMNIETGKENWYSYDASESTLQRFDNSKVEKLTMENNRFLLLILVLSASSLVIMILLLILSAKVKKKSEQKEA